MATRSILPRTIIHVDLDAFYCAVEEQRDPTLHCQAFAVGGRPEHRGVVASCSYAARARGVRSAMSMAVALRLCQNLIIVNTRHSEYRAVSNRVMSVLRARTAHLEQLSIDEAFLDVTDLVNASLTGRALALEIQSQIKRELGLSCSVGVASNKMVAKIATDCGKATVATGNSPHAICVVPFGEEAQFLSPLSVNALWGVGPKMAERLTQLGIQTIGELAAWPQHDLARRLGRHGYDLSQHARGIDNREIVTERESKSISSETTFTRDIADGDELQTTLQEQAQSVAAQLQKQKLQGSTVKIKLRWTDFSVTTRQMTLPHPTAESEVITEAATHLLKHVWQDEKPVRLLGVGVAGLSSIRQLGLFDEVVESSELQEIAVETPNTGEVEDRQRKQQQVRQAMDILEARYGASIVQVGTQLNEIKRHLPEQ